MIRAPWGDESYWHKWTTFSIKTIDEIQTQLTQPSANRSYRPQYVWNLTMEYRRLVLRRYSQGDPVPDLSQHFEALLNAWELSNRLAEEICNEQHLKSCRDWTFELSNLNHYNWCFWLVGLALTLDIPNDQWHRLVRLIGAEGQDELLDRVVATRQKERLIGAGLLHRKPYARLLKAIDAPSDTRPQLLREFVDNWYGELARKGKDELWWYTYGDPIKHPLSMGSYFGRWCIEAAVAAKVFQIDDSLCLGLEHYPGDLLRPHAPSTHPIRHMVKPNFFSTLFRRKI